MLATEWKLEEALVVERMEGLEESIEKGKLEVARNLKSFGIATDQIVSATGLSYDMIASL
jgi:predicted transposase/invertase (TIGR01784 family)